MPYTAAPSGPLGVPRDASLNVFRVAWTSDPAALVQSLAPLLATRRDLDSTSTEVRARVSSRAERARAVAKLAGPARAGEQVLAQIEELEGAKARVEADLLAAYGALHSIEVQQIQSLPRGECGSGGGTGVARAGGGGGDRAGDRGRRR